MLIDLHTHSYPMSDDSFMSADEAVAGAKALGLDGICLTDHDAFWDEAPVRALSRRHERLELAVPMTEFMNRFNPGGRQGTIEIPSGETEYISIDQMRAGQVCQYGFNVRQQGSVDIRFSLTDKNGTVIHSGGRTAGETGEFRVDRTGNYLVFDHAYSLFASKTVDLAIDCRR